MTYKRFSPDANTFLVIRFKPVFGKTEFFNSYSCSRQLSRAGRQDGLTAKRHIMSGLNYSPVERRTRESILKSLESTDPNEIHNALESAAYWGEDWRWAQVQLLRFSQHGDEIVLWAVALGFSLVAVFQGEVDEDLVMPVLARLKECPRLKDVAEEAEEDNIHFVRKRRMGKDIELARRLPPEWRP
jgi:hypothetical protein